MKKSLRFSLICILTLFTFLCAVISISYFIKNEAVEAYSDYRLRTFKLVDGAYMRDATPKGIRFEAGISQTEKYSLPENATFGMLITLDSYLGNEELTHEADINVVDIPTSVWLSTSASKVGEGYLGYYSTLVGGTENNSTDMESEYYSSIFVARGYINIDGQYIYTSNTVERSIAGVAEMAIEQGKETEYATEIVNNSTKITFNIDNQNGEIIERQVVVGSILNENDIPETPIKEGYVVSGYYKDAECTEEFEFSGILKQDTTIYAGWTKPFSYTGADELTITGYLGIDGEIVIPAEIDGKPVTSIGDNAFCNCSNLTTVTFGENSQLISIGDYAFYYCSSLQSIELPSSVTSIGKYAFSNCSSLESIEISNSLASLGTYAFEGLGSFKYNEYDNGLYIGNSENPYLILVTGKDTNITSCVINDNTRFICSNALGSCYNLTSVTMGNNVTHIGERALELNSSDFKYNIYDNGLYLGSNTNPYYALVNVTDTSITSCKIHDDTKIIYKAFAYCDKLESIEIPNGVILIGCQAFEFCSSLTNIEIPDSVINIDYNAFYCCMGLETVTFGENSKLTSIGDYAFYYCSSLGSIEIPSSVTSIGQEAFYDCSSLTSIVLPSSVKSIVDYAFHYCPNLQTVYYGGTSEQWANISINSGLTNVTVYYYSESEPMLNAEQTAYDGNYWRYVDGVPTAWVKEN